MYITRKNFTPAAIFIITNGFSILSWLFPDFGFLRKGFTTQFPILDEDTLGYISVMLLLLSFLWLGYNLFPKSRGLERFETIIVNDRMYFFSICISMLGLCASYLAIMKTMSIGDILFVIQGGQANELKQALYEDYSIGIVSLRYGVILSGSFVIYRRLIGVKNLWMDLLAVLSLLFLSIMSSRLTLIAAIFGGLYLFIYWKGKVKFKFLPVSVAIMVGFLLLSAMNWSRNANFYESKGLGFFSAGVSEILTYTGTPVQGALYAVSNPSVGDESTAVFYSRTTIEPSLTTNSAILDVIRLYGLWGLLLSAVVLFASGLYISFFESYKYGKYIYMNIPIFYSIVEFWRIFLFFQGIIITLIFSCVFLTVSLMLRFGRK
ncbi:hypothetical protein [Klebsiella pneumoniae]